MLVKLRQRVTYANIVATLALIIAVGGSSAYALQGKNTVFSDDIAPNEVKGKDTAEGSLKIPRLEFDDDSVTSTAGGEILQAQAQCPAGYGVTGGGIANGSELNVLYDGPGLAAPGGGDDRDSWDATVRSTAGSQSVRVYAICQRGRTRQ